MPLVTNGLPYFLALGAIAGLGAVIWFGVGSGWDLESVDEVGSAGYEEEMTFGKAMGLVESEGLEAARVAMRALAPLGEGVEALGDRSAHWWLIRDMLDDQEAPERDGDFEESDLEAGSLQVSRKALLEVRDRLERVLELMPTDLAAGRLLAQTEIWLGRPREALRALDDHAKQMPGLHLLAAQVAGVLKVPAECERHALMAANHFEKLSESLTLEEERYAARMRWAEAEAWLGDHEEMLELLKGVPPEFEGKRELMVRGWVGRIRSALGSSNESDGVKALALLEEATEELGLEARLVEIAGMLGSQRENRGRLEKLYARWAEESVGANGGAEVALGSLALVLGKREAGLEHLERAVEASPDNVVALNNLAYGLAEKGDEAALLRAVVLLDKAVAVGEGLGQVPPNVWETRGQVLAKLERWREAAVDLEQALKAMSGQPGVHETLAKVYVALGEPALAEEHRKLGGIEGGK